MTLRWLSHCGYEMGDAGSARQAQYQHVWRGIGTFQAGTVLDADNGDSVLGAGRYSYKWPAGDFTTVNYTTGHVKARTQDYQFWQLRHRLDGWTAPGNRQSNQIYAIAR